MIPQLASWIFEAIEPDPHLVPTPRLEVIVVIAPTATFDEDRARSIVDTFRADNRTLISGRREWLCNGRYLFDVSVRRQTMEPGVAVSMYAFTEIDQVTQ